MSWRPFLFGGTFRLFSCALLIAPAQGFAKEHNGAQGHHGHRAGAAGNNNSPQSSGSVSPHNRSSINTTVSTYSSRHDSLTITERQVTTPGGKQIAWGSFTFANGATTAVGRFRETGNALHVSLQSGTYDTHFTVSSRQGQVVVRGLTGCFDCGGTNNVGAFEGLGNTSTTSGNNNKGVLNGDFNGGIYDGNGNVGVGNGNFNGIGSTTARSGKLDGNGNVGVNNGNSNGNHNTGSGNRKVDANGNVSSGSGNINVGSSNGSFDGNGNVGVKGGSLNGNGNIGNPNGSFNSNNMGKSAIITTAFVSSGAINTEHSLNTDPRVDPSVSQSAPLAGCDTHHGSGGFCLLHR